MKLQIDKFEILITNLPDYENIVAKIYYDTTQYWARLSMEEHDTEPMIKLYPHPEGKFWEFSFDAAIKAIELAKSKLLSKRYKQLIPDDPEKLNYKKHELLESILHHPKKVTTQYNHKIYGPVTDVEAPGIGGVRLTTKDEQMLGFFDPQRTII